MSAIHQQKKRPVMFKYLLEMNLKNIET